MCRKKTLISRSSWKVTNQVGKKNLKNFVFVDVLLAVKIVQQDCDSENDFYHHIIMDMYMLCKLNEYCIINVMYSSLCNAYSEAYIAL